MPPANPSGTLASPSQAGRRGEGPWGRERHQEIEEIRPRRRSHGGWPQSDVEAQRGLERPSSCLGLLVPRAVAPPFGSLCSNNSSRTAAGGAQRAPDHTPCRRHHGAYLTAGQLSSGMLKRMHKNPESSRTGIQSQFCPESVTTSEWAPGCRTVFGGDPPHLLPLKPPK